jgi:4-amino-4-deoxy-L-arabinose transferase-like glycosyltransferase
MASKRDGRTGVWVLAFVSLIFQVPFLNRYLSCYDEGSILAIAESLRHGEVLYRDRVTTLAPLTYELMALLFRLFGFSLWTGRLVQAGVFTLCTLLTYAILRPLVGARWALLAGFAFLAIKPMGFPLWTIVNYSQIAMLFCLASILVFQRFIETHRLSYLVAAGLGVGTAIITKQNIGFLLGASLVLVLVLDAWHDCSRPLHALLARGLGLSLGVLPPVAAVAAFYASNGALDPLVRRTLTGVVSFVRPYATPLPWMSGSEDASAAIFAYTPTSLLHMYWQGQVDLRSPVVASMIAWPVYALYLIPLFALALGILLILRRSAPRIVRQEWTSLVLIVTFSTATYASILYRADWAHLFNVAPAWLLLCFSVFKLGIPVSRWTVRAGVAAYVTWLAMGLILTIAALLAYATPLQTARGRLLVSNYEATEARRLLDYLNRQPQDDRILIMRHCPLYYFLTGRRIPGAFDLVMPGLVNGGGDARLADTIATVGQVVYDPSELPTVPSPLAEYAPQTASALAGRFHVVEILSPSAYVFKAMAPGEGVRRPAVDFWERLHAQRAAVLAKASSSGQSPDFEATGWLMYRVVVSKVREPSVRSCFSQSVVIGPGALISTTPMFYPEEWAPRWGRQVEGGKFEIEVRGEGRRPVIAYSRTIAPPGPVQGVEIRLDAFVGEAVRISLCTTLLAQQTPKAAHGFIGWAEPRMLQLSD